MRKIILPMLSVLVLMSCTSSDNSTVKGVTDSTGNQNQSASTKEAPVLPYKVEKTPDWEIGDPAHVATAMNTLKAFVDNDMNAIKQYLADSVEFYTDNIAFKGSRDSLVKFFTGYRNQMNAIEIRMHDYESVKSKGRGEEWVGMWYTEVDKPKNGKIDSAMVMDDIKIINGKVAIIDSKMRRLKAK